MPLNGVSSIVRISATALLVAFSFAPRIARAAVTGSIEGTVTDQASGKRLSGITVTVTSPALQGEQTEFTDPNLINGALQPVNPKESHP